MRDHLIRDVLKVKQQHTHVCFFVNMRRKLAYIERKKIYNAEYNKVPRLR